MEHADRRESELLRSALRYEAGHPRRTQHILKVYALARLLGQQAGLGEEGREILHAAAILHDIAIRYCKTHGDGDASPENQRRAAPRLVRGFLEDAGYPEAWIPRITRLVEAHHDYDGPRDQLLQCLMEADLIVNCYETQARGPALARMEAVFRTELGRELFSLAAENAPRDGA